MVFSHLLDAENRIWGQSDSVLTRGDAPATSWVEGEIITDEYEIAVDPATPPGEYVIEIGMYDASTEQRLPAYGPRSKELEGARILLEGVQVRATE